MYRARSPWKLRWIAPRSCSATTLPVYISCWLSLSADMRSVARVVSPTATTPSNPTAAPILTPTGRSASQPERGSARGCVGEPAGGGGGGGFRASVGGGGGGGEKKGGTFSRPPPADAWGADPPR